MSESDIALLRSPSTIRARCRAILDAGVRGELAQLDVRLDRMDAVVARVVRVTRAAYPDLRIPYHSRWGHFRAGKVDRVASFDREIAALDRDEQARVRFELAITSVLLDAGAGTKWRYHEASSARDYDRSEGLAVASFHMFRDGLFSGDRRSMRADAEGLDRVDAATLARGFHVSDANPMVGLDGRASLLARLGAAMRAAPRLFGADHPRLGGLYDHLRAQVDANGELPARLVLAALLEGLAPIWPGRIELGGVNLGDVWRHPHAGGEGLTKGLVPFHKLSQWLAYSLVEPLEHAGIRVTSLDELTGLAEYRNGGLFVDEGVLAPRRAEILTSPHAPGDEVIVEWRALTVALLDETATRVRAAIGKSAAELPLCNVLEGGTWAAGREIAREKREGGGPPIQVVSDGTVF
ncbi:URC4/urg3 family protein [Sandaracinus amylolyticus]|uniref:Putative pyrimidine-degrading protein DUF1688 n=1 Tax=Sandaracinus amylolyticus TaxID=927083 RepID=A0A0F6SED8_9BACT|nr:URC4/urg3 family protein [Sandaracinus amylolyticus]AKF05019.1 Putative pyrimidine-degrading protein DUF1688 [Sandaracinus amylolyticus]